MSVLEDKIRSAGAQLSAAGPESLPGWFTAAGLSAWLLVGIAGILALAGWLFVYTASISIPLLLAMVVGMISYPLCEKMIDRGIPKSAAAGIVLLLLAAIIVLVVWVVVAGVITQWPAIEAQLQAGFDQMAAQMEAAGLDPGAIADSLKAASGSGTASAAGTGVLTTLTNAVTSGLSNTFALLFGLFIGATLLFYVLTDFPAMATWISGHMGGLPVDVGEGIVEDAVDAMRGYFRATTITGIVVGSVIGLAMVLLGVPLALSVALVTVLTCYIPFFGAIISGAFAFLVALGSNGLTTALILLVIVLLTQNVLQTVINARVMGDSLNLHPFVVLTVTMLGGIFGGLLGAALAAPIAALLINAGRRLSTAMGPGAEPQAQPEVGV